MLRRARREEELPDSGVLMSKMSKKTSKPMIVTYDDDPLKAKDPWKKLRKRTGVTVIDTARRDP